MTYRGIDAPNVGPIIVDLETCGLPNADEFLEPIPDAVLDDSPIVGRKGLVDTVKIAADLEQRRLARIEENAAAVAKVEAARAARVEKLALDWNVGRIVAAGWWTADGGLVCEVCHGEGDEADVLRRFWAAAKHRTVIGFGVKTFDGPYLIQRSRYLGVTPIDLDLGRYSKRGVIDLFHELTFNDAYAQVCMKRGLKSFARRFGIPVPDETSGAEVPALIAAGDWDAVKAHCTADVELTVALAARLGYVAVREEVGAL